MKRRYVVKIGTAFVRNPYTGAKILSKSKADAVKLSNEFVSHTGGKKVRILKFKIGRKQR